MFTLHIFFSLRKDSPRLQWRLCNIWRKERTFGDKLLRKMNNIPPRTVCKRVTILRIIHSNIKNHSFIQLKNVGWSRIALLEKTVLKGVFFIYNIVVDLKKISLKVDFDPFCPNEHTPKCHTRLESYGSLLSGGKQKLFVKSWKLSEFL